MRILLNEVVDHRFQVVAGAAVPQGLAHSQAQAAAPVIQQEHPGAPVPDFPGDAAHVSRFTAPPHAVAQEHDGRIGIHGFQLHADQNGPGPDADFVTFAGRKRHGTGELGGQDGLERPAAKQPMRLKGVNRWFGIHELFWAGFSTACRDKNAAPGLNGNFADVARILAKDGPDATFRRVPAEGRCPAFPGPGMARPGKHRRGKKIGPKAASPGFGERLTRSLAPC